MKISTILATKGSSVITIRPEQTLKDAVVTLAKHRIGAMVVVNEAGDLVGILSERDIVRAAARSDDALKMKVSEAMTSSVIVGSPQDDVLSVVQTMTEKRFRHLPIVDQGRLAGIVSIGDMVKAQLQEYQGEIETLETRIIEGQLSA